MCMVINQLALQPRGPVWHPNCIRDNVRRFCGISLNRFQARVASARTGKRPMLAFVVCFGDAIKSRNTRVLACWSGAPKTLPQTWRKFHHEDPHSSYFAPGGSAGVSSLRPDFVFPGSISTRGSAESVHAID